LFKDDKEIRAEKKKLAHQKIHYTERVTYLDGVQFDADQTPGVGSYNTTLDRVLAWIFSQNQPLCSTNANSLEAGVREAVSKESKRCPALGLITRNRLKITNPFPEKKRL
jgi:hypothetical protein